MNLALAILCLLLGMARGESRTQINDKDISLNDDSNKDLSARKLLYVVGVYPEWEPRIAKFKEIWGEKGEKYLDQSDAYIHGDVQVPVTEQNTTTRRKDSKHEDYNEDLTGSSYNSINTKRRKNPMQIQSELPAIIQSNATEHPKNNFHIGKRREEYQYIVENLLKPETRNFDIKINDIKDYPIINQSYNPDIITKKSVNVEKEDITDSKEDFTQKMLNNMDELYLHPNAIIRKANNFSKGDAKNYKGEGKEDFRQRLFSNINKMYLHSSAFTKKAANLNQNDVQKKEDFKQGTFGNIVHPIALIRKSNNLSKEDAKKNEDEVKEDFKPRTSSNIEKLYQQPSASMKTEDNLGKGDVKNSEEESKEDFGQKMLSIEDEIKNNIIYKTYHPYDLKKTGHNKDDRKLFSNISRMYGRIKMRKRFGNDVKTVLTENIPISSYEMIPNYSMKNPRNSHSIDLTDNNNKSPNQLRKLNTPNTKSNTKTVVNIKSKNSLSADQELKWIKEVLIPRLLNNQRGSRTKSQEMKINMENYNSNESIRKSYPSFVMDIKNSRDKLNEHKSNTKKIRERRNIKSKFLDSHEEFIKQRLLKRKQVKVGMLN